MPHSTPRGRRGSAGVLLMVTIALLLAAPAAPAAAAAGLSLTPSQRTVTGSALTLVPTGGGAQGRVTVVVTDAAGVQAVYSFGPAAVADGRALSVDLSAPNSGTTPRNGRATVTLSDSTGILAQTQVTIDRTASAPSVSAAAHDRRVAVSWSKIGWPEAVTYRLERSAGGTTRVVYQGASAAFTDRDLSPGRVAYALTAGVPGAGGGINWSAPATAGARIVAPATRRPRTLHLRPTSTARSWPPRRRAAWPSGSRHVPRDRSRGGWRPRASRAH